MADVFQETLAQIGTFFNDAVTAYLLPNLKVIAWVVILLVIGYIVGKITKIIVVKIMNAMGFKKLTTRTWSESILRMTGYKKSIVDLIGDIAKWIIYILFIAFIIQNIGLPGIADIFTQTASFLPRIIGAILIVVLGFIVADFFGKIFEEAGRRFLQEETLSALSGGVARYSLAIISIIIALAIIGIDTTSLTIMFAIVFSTLMVLMLIGLKDIFPNFTAGLSLRKELRPGEWVSVGKYSGQVEKVNPLSVVLRDGKRAITVPNYVFVQNPIERKK